MPWIQIQFKEKTMKCFSLFLILFSLKSFSKDCNQFEIKKKLTPKYAKNFTIDYYENFKILKVKGAEFLLSPDLKKIDCHAEFKIQSPLKNIVLDSTTYLPSFEILHSEKLISGFVGKKYI